MFGRKLLRQIVTVTTAVALTATILFGVGLWRRSEDSRWCQQAVAGGVVTGDQPVKPGLPEQLRSACIVQRQRQRSMLGAIWRTDGRETARCGFEFARMQLISYDIPEGHRPFLERYGVNDPDFDISNRQDQDRFIRACLSDGPHEAG